MQLIEFTTPASGAAAWAARLFEVLAEWRYLSLSDTATYNILTGWEKGCEFLEELKSIWLVFSDATIGKAARLSLTFARYAGRKS